MGQEPNRTNVPTSQSFRPMIGARDGLMYQRTNVPMYQCTNEFVPIMGPKHWYIGTLVHWVMGRPLHQSWAQIIGTLVHWYIGTLVHWVLGRPLHQSWAQIIGTLVHWFVAALALSVNPKPSVYVCRVYVLHEKVELLPTSPCRYIILIVYQIEKVEREGRYSQTIKLGSI